MLRGKCVSAASGFNSAEWPTVFVDTPKTGEKVFKLPTITGSLNTPICPAVVDSSVSMTVSAVAHRIGVFQSGCVYVQEPYIEVTLA